LIILEDFSPNRDSQEEDDCDTSIETFNEPCSYTFVHLLFTGGRSCVYLTRLDVVVFYDNDW